MKHLQRFFIFLVLGLLLGAGIGALQIKDEISKTTNNTSYADPAMAGVEIGGSFELVDHNGNVVTDQSWPDQYLLLFFGFTHCPDICPLNLSIIQDALQSLPDEMVAKVQPIMITIDPDRDDVAAMADYVSLFHPKMVGLTGTQAQISVATKAYRVYEQKVLFDAAGKDPNDYTMNHSSFTYLMAPSGELLDVFAHNTPPKEMVDTLKKFVK